MKHWGKKLAALLLCAAMATGLMPGMHLTALAYDGNPYAGLVGTGGESKIRITEGEVLVNGEVCTQRGRKLHPGDRVELGGETLLVAEA